MKGVLNAADGVYEDDVHYNLLLFGFRGSTWTSSLTLKAIPWVASSVTVSRY